MSAAAVQLVPFLRVHWPVPVSPMHQPTTGHWTPIMLDPPSPGTVQPTQPTPSKMLTVPLAARLPQYVVVAQLIPYWSPRPLSAAAVHEEPFHVEYLPELVTRTQYVVVGQETLRMSSPGTSVVSGDQVLPL